MVAKLKKVRNLQIIPLASNALIILLQEIPYWEAQQNLTACAMPTITEVAKHRVRPVELAASVMVKNQQVMLPLLLLASALLTHTGLMMT
jgi:hypothetical protein